MQFPITIGLRRSRLLDAILLFVLILSSVAIHAFQCSPAVRTGLFVANLVSVSLVWRLLRPTIKAIRLERNGDVFIARLGETEFLPAKPKPGATIHPWLSIIRLNTADGRTATVFATVDSQNQSDFRRLRMFIRWQANFSEPSDDV